MRNRPELPSDLLVSSVILTVVSIVFYRIILDIVLGFSISFIPALLVGFWLSHNSIKIAYNEFERGKQYSFFKKLLFVGFYVFVEAAYSDKKSEG